MRQRLPLFFLLVCAACVGWFVLQPTPLRARDNARRTSCQLNLKQIGLALQQYTQDYDDKLPVRQWGQSLLIYAKSKQVFQCPEVSRPPTANDYFFNARFLGADITKISSPKNLILMGDGQDNAPFNTTLSQFPAVWRTDETSPAWRHMGTANYAFADGHVEWLKPNRVSKDFREVSSK